MFLYVLLCRVIFDVLIPGVAIAVSFISNECVYAGERERSTFFRRVRKLRMRAMKEDEGVLSRR
jgi:hypothetical protein